MRALFLFMVAASAACDAEEHAHAIDATPRDGDAGASTVVVTADCVGITDIAVELGSNGNNEFTIDGAVRSTLELEVGDVVRFSTAHDHNFESAPGVPDAFRFTTGPAEAGGQTACVRFTAATPSPVRYECDPHVGDGMIGTLTVD